MQTEHAKNSNNLYSFPLHDTVDGEIDVIKSERKSTIQTEPAVRSRNIVETQGFCYNDGEHLVIEKEAGAYAH